MAIPLATKLKDALAKYPYYGIADAKSDLHPGPFVGYYLATLLPPTLAALTESADPAERFCLMAYNFSRPLLLYPFDHPRASALLLARNATDFERLRYQKPTRLVTYVREGDINNYLDYFVNAGGGLLPIMAYMQARTSAELMELIPAINRLLEERRPSVVVIPSRELNAVALRKAKSSLRATITLKQAAALYPPTINLSVLAPKMAHNPSAPVEGLVASGLEDMQLLFFGTGTHTHHFDVEAPTVDNLSSWKLAFKHVQSQVIEATVTTALANEHHSRVTTVLRDSGILVPHLNRYPSPPTLTSIGDMTVSHGLKVKADQITKAFMDFDNETLQAFNPVVGRPTGVLDSMLSRPALLSRSITETKGVLDSMGYNLKLAPDQVLRLEKQRAFYDLQISPLKPISGLECLAYFQPSSYPCKKTVTNPETKQVVWKAGKFYRISPNWTKQNYPGGSEPIIEDGVIKGEETFTIRYSVLTLEVETQREMVAIAENECRESVEEEFTRALKEAEEGEKVEREEWRPMLDEFLVAFDIPKVPTITDLQPQRFKELQKRLLARMPMLKTYQSEIAVLNTMKRGGILGSEMGAGKTFQAIGVMYLRGKAFNLIIVPPMLVPQWLKTLQDCRFWARALLTHESVNKLIRHYKRLQGRSPTEKARIMFAQQEFYVTTPEFLSLGAQGNRVYSPWTAIHQRDTDRYDLKRHGVPAEMVEIKGTRYHVTAEAQALELSTHRSHQYGHHIKKCPNCGKEHGAGFSDSGVCICGYRAFSFTGHRQRVNSKGDKATDWIFGKDMPTDFTTVSSTPAPTPAQARITTCIRTTQDGKEVLADKRVGAWVDLPDVQQKQHSDYFAPAYKRLGKIFGMKVIDEVHLIANLDSQKGASVYSIYADETYVMSGTISRGYVTDIESALAHVHEPETPCFPFAPWNRKAFREQFVTERIKTTILSSGTKKSSASMVPEASNVNRLRRMLNCVTTRADEAVIEAEWKLPQPTRFYVGLKLNPKNQEYYDQVLAKVVSWARFATKKDLHRNAMSRLWELRHICENEEKLDLILSYAKQWTLEGRKFVIVSPTKHLYQRIRDSLYALGIKTLAVDDTTPPDRRQELTSRFEDPLFTALVSRTKLVCTGLNTLVHADRLIIAGGEYHPATVRQMEKRLIRPGQKSPRVEIIYPIVRMHPKQSVEEEMLKLMLMKEASVNEVLKGQVRWVKPAMLVESAMESKGAVRVLEALTEKKASGKLGDYDLDSLFQELQAAEVAAQPKLQVADLDQMDLEGLDSEQISVRPTVLEMD